MSGGCWFAGAVVTPAEFQIALETRRKAKQEKLNAAPARPLTDDEVHNRIAALKSRNAELRRENALLREQAEQLRNKEALRMAQEIIKRRQSQLDSKRGVY
jgi:hypothetical protein